LTNGDAVMRDDNADEVMINDFVGSWSHLLNIERLIV
jgi:hypothetical protein